MMELILTIMYCLDIGLQIQTDRKVNLFVQYCVEIPKLMYQLAGYVHPYSYFL